ncbi:MULTISPECIES: hypothetical protein [unclassified Leptolyngbya]|uniref:hypothetical protein n=1 Tax=unclassified Leptolyngbya TaxID=2650499 RepID=UPI00168885CF|nr:MULTISPECIES: hypothetical protein [unclassified Leptolyngbya]MBD1913688.1 hypothetical protein [Leptolyngbya sp. FACHB-8]MBD2157068.1 hypothetical protein [Leptolyngbya sp. FACHB-16]
MNDTTGWYVVKRPEGSCEIVAVEVGQTLEEGTERWGPFASQSEAFARRVGLIRAGKCQPI